MAAVSYSDGTEKIIGGAESMIRVWISPSTMDSNDTVVLPTVTGATVRIISCVTDGDGDAVTATVSSFTVTIDAAGGATNETYVLTYLYDQG